MAVHARSRYSGVRYLEAVVLIIAILYFGKAVLVPVALAVLLTFALTPVVLIVQGWGVPRVVAAIFTVLFTLLLFALVGWVVGGQVQNLAREMPKHREEIENKIAELRLSGEGPFGDLFKMIRDIGKAESPPLSGDDSAKGPPAQKVILQTEGASSFEQLGRIVGPVLEPLAYAGLVVILIVFMLVKREDLRNRFISLVGHGRLTGTTRVIVDAAQRLSRFLLTQVLINLGFGAMLTAGLLAIGAPFAFLWGFLAFVLRFIPYIGVWVSVIFPFALSFAISPGWTQPMLILALFLALELITSNVIEPLLFGHGTGVSPVALLVAAAFWALVWGPIGLVLSTPLTVCLVVLGQHVPRLRFFKLLLGDEEPLAPRFAFFQRLLVQDRAEAEQVALSHAKASGPEHVYDDVFLPAVMLAWRDREAGSLPVEEEAYIVQATKDIMYHMKAEPAEAAVAGGEPAPPKPQAPSPAAGLVVLGVAAHNEIEELSLFMLGRLLEADECRVDVMSTRALPAEVEARIRERRPALLYMSVVPPGGLAQARFLCKQLRGEFPDLPIVVGYWGSKRRYARVLTTLRAAGASYVTTSLLQSRSQILALSKQARDEPVGGLRPAGAH